MTLTLLQPEAGFTLSNPSLGEIEETFDRLFHHVGEPRVSEYKAAIRANKCQLYSLHKDDGVTLIITAITEVHGVRYFNGLELAGTFGFAQYPNEIDAVMCELGRNAKCDEIRLTADREGSIKLFKQNGYELKYSEYGKSL